MNQFNDANWTGRVPRAMHQSRWGAYARLIAPETARVVRAGRVCAAISLGALALLAACVACLAL